MMDPAAPRDLLILYGAKPPLLSSTGTYTAPTDTVRGQSLLQSSARQNQNNHQKHAGSDLYRVGYYNVHRSNNLRILRVAPPSNKIV